jgi:hypothetical protein
MMRGRAASPVVKQSRNAVRVIAFCEKEKTCVIKKAVTCYSVSRRRAGQCKPMSVHTSCMHALTLGDESG